MGVSLPSVTKALFGGEAFPPSLRDWFAERGFVCWCVDMEGYAHSDQHRPINCDIANGAADLAAATDYIAATRGIESFLTYGISSGALRAALFAQQHPERVARLALDAFVWTGAGSPTLAERRKKLPEFLAKNRRPIDRAFVHSIFDRDHPGTADEATIDAFAEAICALDDFSECTWRAATARLRAAGDPADRYMFRTSPLRNAALQPAYFHNGAFTKLEDAIRHHLDVAGSARYYDAMGYPGHVNCTDNFDAFFLHDFPPTFANGQDFIPKANELIQAAGDV